MKKRNSRTIFNAGFSIVLVFLALVLSILSSCKKDLPQTNEGYGPTPYDLRVPKGFPEPEIPAFNPMTEEGVALGRKLYFDNILSMNGNACASCHDQQLAFSVPGNGPTGYNILPHINLAWKASYGWLGGEDLLDHVALADLAEGNPFLQANNDTILQRLQNHPYYPEEFQKAFGVNILSLGKEDRQLYISYALAQFLRTMISDDSKFDRYRRQEAQLTPSEMNGFVIFNTEKGDCFHCHPAAGGLFTDREFHNNGLDSVHNGKDQGRYLQTGNPDDMGVFTTPTLRNIALTAPYMHDGRFQTLEEVVEFYNMGGHNSPTIDPLMKHVGTGLNLSPQEKQDLVNFLHTLTDQVFLEDTSLSSPF